MTRWLLFLYERISLDKKSSYDDLDPILKKNDDVYLPSNLLLQPLGSES